MFRTHQSQSESNLLGGWWVWALKHLPRKYPHKRHQDSEIQPWCRNASSNNARQESNPKCNQELIYRYHVYYQSHWKSWNHTDVHPQKTTKLCFLLSLEQGPSAVWMSPSPLKIHTLNSNPQRWWCWGLGPCEVLRSWGRSTHEWGQCFIRAPQSSLALPPREDTARSEDSQPLA